MLINFNNDNIHAAENDIEWKLQLIIASANRMKQLNYYY